MTTFAKRIEQAATTYPGATSTAWVQYLVGTDNTTVFVRMQAPEIMKQFRGSVKFGTGRCNNNPRRAAFLLLPDPKGILFFGSQEELDIVGNIKVKNAKYPVAGSSSKVIVETEFGSPGGGFEGFARVRFCDRSGFTVRGNDITFSVRRRSRYFCIKFDIFHRRPI
jgi:hypothetical protein